jgi:flagellar hook-length control protein FliK
VNSVTSDLAASVSLQAAPPKSARPDPSQASDSFGSLVDSNAAASTGNDRAAASTAQQPSDSQRRANDDASANADTTRSRNAAADQATRNASDDRNAGAQQNSDANAAANVSTDADAAQRSKTKSDAPKADAAKPATKSSSGNASAPDASTAPASPAPQSGALVVTPNPVAIALAVIVPVTDTPAATPASSGNATAPLAIAAAAIAASSAAGAPLASPAQVKVDSNAAAPVTASAAPAGASSNTAATAKIAVQAAVNTAIGKPVNQQVPPTGISEVAQAVAPAAAVAPKTTLLKATVAAQGKTATSGDAVAAPGPDPSATTAAVDAPNTATPQPAVAGKPEAANGLVDAAKANAATAASSDPAPIVATHEHSAVAATATAPSDSLDTGAQPTGTFQSQLPAAVAAAPPAGPLSVTAASNAPVPLSGIAVEIAASVRSGKSHFEIRLDPADLGRIDVRIDVDRNGQVTSHLTVEKPETLSMLRQDAPQLQQALDDAGFKTGGGGLQFSLRDQSSSGQNSGNDNGRNAQRLIISDDTIPAAVAGRSYGRSLGSSSGVDIRV